MRYIKDDIEMLRKSFIKAKALGMLDGDAFEKIIGNWVTGIIKEECEEYGELELNVQVTSKSEDCWLEIEITSNSIDIGLLEIKCNDFNAFIHVLGEEGVEHIDLTTNGSIHVEVLIYRRNNGLYFRACSRFAKTLTDIKMYCMALVLVAYSSKVKLYSDSLLSFTGGIVRRSYGHYSKKTAKELYKLVSFNGIDLG